MPKIIKDQSVVEDDWTVIAKDHQGALPQGQVLLPLGYWLTNRDTLANGSRANNVGLWLDSDEDVAVIGGSVNDFPVIAVNFPSFADGRGFSLGRLLRERYHFRGELRAMGPIRDQLFYLRRCGFNTFLLSSPAVVEEEALSSLKDFSVTYQSDAEQKNPLFRR